MTQCPSTRAKVVMINRFGRTALCCFSVITLIRVGIILWEEMVIRVDKNDLISRYYSSDQKAFDKYASCILSLSEIWGRKWDYMAPR